MPQHDYFPYTKVFLIQVKYIIIWESRFSLCIFFIFKFIKKLLNPKNVKNKVW